MALGPIVCLVAQVEVLSISTSSQAILAVYAAAVANVETQKDPPLQ